MILFILLFETKLSGFVATNTTIAREQLTTPLAAVNKAGSGGLSGKPLFQKSKTVVEYLSHNTQGKIPIIASGGIFTGQDAWQQLHAGASLVQVWTGFVYEGPAIVKNICTYLSQKK